MSIINIAAYKFVALDDLTTLRETLKADCLALNLRGTILIAAEGINMFLAGERADIEIFFTQFKDDARFVERKSVGRKTFQSHAGENQKRNYFHGHAGNFSGD
jgi:predicted sulfurtransferase